MASSPRWMVRVVDHPADALCRGVGLACHDLFDERVEHLVAYLGLAATEQPSGGVVDVHRG